jgi:hypothetical protein
MRRESVRPEDRPALRRLSIVLAPLLAVLLATAVAGLVAKAENHEGASWILLATCICFLGMVGLVLVRFWPWPREMPSAGGGLVGLLVSLLRPAGQRVALSVMSVAVLGLGMWGLVWAVVRR